MNHLFKPFIKHTFLNKTSLSVSLLIITILLSACGGDTTENSTTIKEPETKVIPKKEVVKVETKKFESKEEVKPGPTVEVKAEEIKEAPTANAPLTKLPYSKADMLATLATIKIADPSSIVDTAEKEKEEYQTKTKEILEKEVKKIVDDEKKSENETIRYTKSYEYVSKYFLNPKIELSPEEMSKVHKYFEYFHYCGGTGAKTISFEKLEKDKAKFEESYTKNKFLVDSKKGFLQELNSIKKEMEVNVENGLPINSKNAKILSLLSTNKKLYVSLSYYDDKSVLGNILASAKEVADFKPDLDFPEYEVRFKSKFIEDFQEQIDIEPAKKLYSLIEMEAQNELVREKIKEELQTVRVNKIRSSKKYNEIDSYELALEVFPPNLSTNNFASTKDLSVLAGKVYELFPAQCIQSLGSGKALMKLEYFSTPVLLEPLNTAYSNSVYVEKKIYKILVKFNGITLYKNLLGAEAQAIKAQVIYVE